MFNEDAQDLNNVGCIDNGAPGNNKWVHEALIVQKGQQYWFGLANMDLGLDWARLPLLNPLLGLFFGQRGMITEHRLVHGDNVDMAKSGSRLQWQTWCRYCFCSSKRRFGTHLVDFFSKPKSWWRVAWIVETDVPWSVTRASMLRQQCSLTAVVTAAMRAWGPANFFCLSPGTGHQCFHHSSPSW